MKKRLENTLQDAAVLVPVFRDGGGDLRIVVVRRTEGGAHGGQIAFPGGKRAQGDRSLLETALREAEEEIGIDRTLVNVLEALPVVDTMTTGFRIHPFLGALNPTPKWRIEIREIAEVLEVKVAELLDPLNQTEEEWNLPGWPCPRRIRFFRLGEHKLWGASYRILRPLLPRLASGDWGV
jgi:8-oxo-dGTP pyrophosphatase MutT (NUDIX family)